MSPSEWSNFIQMLTIPSAELQLNLLRREQKHSAYWVLYLKMVHFKISGCIRKGEKETVHENKAHIAGFSLKEDTLSLFYKDYKKELKIF